MEKSKVYFSDFHTVDGLSLPKKLARLIKRAGFDNIDFEDKFAAIKIHFGEPGNLAYLRPNYAKVVVDMVKERGGKAFLTDCNTLYVGGRKNALDHMDSAYENGFNPFQTGCHIIIADGLKGNNEAEVPVEGGEFVEKAKIGRAIMDADVFITLTHFKGHSSTGFGGCLKNIGMGSGSRAGKMEMHSSGKPFINQDACIGCGTCQRNCAREAITITDRKATINHDNCVGCGHCIPVCPKDAITPPFDQANDVLNKKIAEYSYAVLHGRPNFHISLVCDVSPLCDCCSENDVPIIPNVGMFASFDPVALDMACADACNAQPVFENSELAHKEHVHDDHFRNLHPDTNWESCVEHAEKLGLGSREYELIKV